MKNIRIRMRWFNLGAMAATFLYLWLAEEEQKQKKPTPKVFTATSFNEDGSYSPKSNINA